MKGFTKISLRVSLLLVVCFALSRVAAGTVDDAQSFALQAGEPYVKEGFQVREDYWGGDLGSGEKKAVRQQLFKGNEYWFWLGTEVERAKVRFMSMIPNEKRPTRRTVGKEGDF